LRILPIKNFTPEIRNIANFEFNDKYARYIPKRFIFYSDLSIHLDNPDKLILLKKMNSIARESKSLDIAVKRFNSAIDNFYSTKIERLLDVAIAFESLFLNDTSNHDEVSYRLQIRAAKFLGTTYDEKINILRILKALYDNRSKIAHGDTLKPKDEEKVAIINIEAMDLLRRAIIKIVLMQKTTSFNWSEYWQKITLK